jgi:hypothetical protein
MATQIKLAKVINLVSFQAHRVGWRLSKRKQRPFNWPEISVPSPPCGMATYILVHTSYHTPLFQAHRVGWRPKSNLLKSLILSRSKPTVWDGDSVLLGLVNTSRSAPTVPSPPCGMATPLPSLTIPHPRLSVLSPLCGMATSPLAYIEVPSGTRSKPTVWDGDFVWEHFYSPCQKVLSPPCGMETFCDLSTEVASSLLPGSKPTVWDGDFLNHTGFRGK